jgi:hypothetical protein
MDSIRLALILISLILVGCASRAPYIGTADLVEACSAKHMVGGDKGTYLEPVIYAACYTYLAASVHAIYAARADANVEISLPAVCIPDPPELEKAREIFIDYLSDNPDRADSQAYKPPYLLVVEALSRAYPCRGDQPVFRDVSTIVGSSSNDNGTNIFCSIENIDSRTFSINNQTSSITTTDKGTADKDENLQHDNVYFLDPGLRDIRGECRIRRDRITEVTYINGVVSLVAGTKRKYELVYLPKEGTSSTRCLSIRDTETLKLVGSSCP